MEPLNWATEAKQRKRLRLVWSIVAALAVAAFAFGVGTIRNHGTPGTSNARAVGFRPSERPIDTSPFAPATAIQSGSTTIPGLGNDPESDLSASPTSTTTTTAPPPTTTTTTIALGSDPVCVTLGATSLLLSLAVLPGAKPDLAELRLSATRSAVAIIGIGTGTDLHDGAARFRQSVRASTSISQFFDAVSRFVEPRTAADKRAFKQLIGYTSGSCPQLAIALAQNGASGSP